MNIFNKYIKKSRFISSIEGNLKFPIEKVYTVLHFVHYLHIIWQSRVILSKS